MSMKRYRNSNTVKTFLFIFTILILSACTDDPYEKYLGFWKLEKENKQGWVNTIQINKDGDSFLLKGIKRKGGIYKPLSSKEEVIVLKKSEGQLSVETGFGAYSLGLSEDKNILRIEKKVYKRITNQMFSDLNKKMKEKIILENSNKEKCNEIKSEFQKEFKKICPGFVPNCKGSDINPVKKKYKEKQKSIPNCNAVR